MTKSGKIREFLGAHPGATLAAIVQGTKLDAEFVSTICSQCVRKGVLIGDSAGGYTLNPEWVPKHGQGLKRAGKKVIGNVAHRRAAKKKRQLREQPTTEDRVAATAVTPARHVRTTLGVLMSVVDMDGASPLLVSGFSAHAEAVELMG